MFRPSALIVSLEQKLSSGENNKIIKLSLNGKIKLNGLYIMGADFDTKIQSAKTETNELIQLPPLSISFIEAGNDDVTTLPLYNSKSRKYLLVDKI